MKTLRLVVSVLLPHLPGVKDMQSLAFPMHLQENGLLRRTDKSAAVLSLLQMMARTPAGSWKASPAFGLRDLFEGGQQRVDVARLVAERINATFKDLGVEGYVVTEVLHEISMDRDTDTYTITLENLVTAETLRTSVRQES